MNGQFPRLKINGIRGDIVTLRRESRDVLPMGSCLARGEAANVFPGDHVAPQLQAAFGMRGAWRRLRSWKTIV
jgi:hypothetical protein